MAIWVTIVAIGICTYRIRLSFIYLFGRIDDVPTEVETTLRYVPPAILAALAVPALVTIRPSLSATIFDARLLAGAAGFAVAWRTESVLATIAAGMGTLWLLRLLLF